MSAPQSAENGLHRIDRDSRGYYCLDCPWPGADFVFIGRLAADHVAQSSVFPPATTEGGDA